MIRRPSTLALAAFAAAFSACETATEPQIVPEFEYAYSFESGFEGWAPGAVDVVSPPDAWSPQTTAAEAAQGQSSVRIDLDNQHGAAKVWLEREFEVEPDQAYTVDITLSLGSRDPDGTDPWTVLAGAHAAPPTSAAALTLQDGTGIGDASGDVVWAEKSYRVSGTADEDGRLVVVIGVSGTTVDSRSYWFDDVRLVFTRAG